MRGQDEIRKFGKIMLSTLNLEKNTNKGDWSRMTWMEMMINLELRRRAVHRIAAGCEDCSSGAREAKRKTGRGMAG